MVGQIALSEPFILIAGTLSLLSMVIALIIFAFLFQRKLIQKEIAYREIEKLLDDQELKTAYAVIEGQEKERKRIAQDLHDNVGSLLAVLKLYLHNATDLKQPLEVSKVSRKALGVLEEVINESRRIAYELDAIAMKHSGLATAVDQLCQALRDSERIKVNSFIDLECPIQDDLAFHVYRIVQELFNNTLKHANASWVNLHIQIISNAFISVIFEDDGRGYDVGLAEKQGMGLRNIEMRVNRFTGKMNIESVIGRGTTVVIEMPIDNSL